MITLQPGDYFAVRTNSWLARLIILKERICAMDDEAKYNHAGIIVDCRGNTYESLGRIDHYHIDNYIGCPILIARHKSMTPDAFRAGMKEVLKYDGKVYPVWRLILHLTGLAKFFKMTFPVCSELVGEHAYHAGGHTYDGWGWNPDHLADLWEISKYYDVIYEGIWKGVNDDGKDS